MRQEYLNYLKMKAHLLTLVLTICVCFHCCALAAQVGFIPECNRFTVYLDNLLVGNEHGVDKSRIPDALFQNYYKEHIDFSNNAPLPQKVDYGYIKKVYIEIDTTIHKRHLHIRTKKAKEGFLSVNKSIMDSCSKAEKFSIVYVYNNRVVTTRKDVMQLLRLRKRHIRSLEITQNEQAEIIIVYINCFRKTE